MSNKKINILAIICLLLPLLVGGTVALIFKLSYKTYTYTYELHETGSDDGHDISILSVTKTKSDEDNLVYAEEGQTFVIIEMQFTNNREDTSYDWTIFGSDFTLLVDGVEDGISGKLDPIGDWTFPLLFGIFSTHDLDAGETKTMSMHFPVDDNLLSNEMKLSYNCSSNDDVGHESRTTLVWKLS